MKLYITPLMLFLVLQTIGAADFAPITNQTTNEITEKSIGSNSVNLPKIVAKVNGESITKESLQLFFDATIQAANATVSDLSNEQIKDGYKQLLDNLIVDTIVAQKSGTYASDSEVDAEITKIKKQHTYEESFNKELSKARQTESDLRRNIAKMLAQKRWMESQVNIKPITDQDAKEYFNNNIHEFTDEKTQVLYIKFEDVKESVIKYLENKSRREQEQDVIKELRESAQIEIFLPNND